ncbi:sugar transferase [Pannus brasiliensis CCIBt3594]|uniref:Sugar transferase n=1 Tax=Pannus brasiliensis CCIBt3594 TaxID=1427578 RepID=A0AAW9QUG9_9CHRO
MQSLISRKTIPWFLLAGDIISLLGCLNLAFFFRLGSFIEVGTPFLYLMIGTILLGLYIADTYRLDIQIAGLWAPARVLVSLCLMFSLLGTIIYLTGWWGTTHLVGRGIWSLSLLFFTIWGVASRIFAYRGLQFALARTRWLVIGDRDKMAYLELDYRQANPLTEFVYWGEREEKKKMVVGGNSPVLLRQSVQFEVLSQQIWSGVIIDEDLETLSELTTGQLMDMRLRGVYIYKPAEFYEEFFQKIPPKLIQDDWFAFTSGFALFHNRINVKIKRLFDIVVSSFLCLLISPIAAITALAIKLDSPGPVFYSQIRTGLNGQKFKVHKFRSMRQDAEKSGARWASTTDSRITRVGKFIRLTRVDELPQFWNVLKGEMSLIGPRPERPEFDSELRQEIPYYDIRYLVKPGITGWAQVRYPYGASVEDAYQKVAYDLYYIKHYSLLLDVAIVLKTIRVIFLGKGR